MEEERRPLTICWQCENAVPDRDGTKGCSWSRDFIPVEGWTAKRRLLLIQHNGATTSYTVLKCPLFKEG